MIVSKNYKMAELIHLNFEILSVLKRFIIEQKKIKEEIWQTRIYVV